MIRYFSFSIVYQRIPKMRRISWEAFRKSFERINLNPYFLKKCKKTNSYRENKKEKSRGTNVDIAIRIIKARQGFLNALDVETTTIPTSFHALHGILA